MSRVVEDVVAMLLAQVAPTGGVWPLVNTREPAVYPYIVYQRVSDLDNVSLGGPSGLQRTRLQLDVYARDYATAYAMVTAIDTAFAASVFQNIALSVQDFFDEPTRTYRVSRDYSLWSSNP